MLNDDSVPDTPVPQHPISPFFIIVGVVISVVIKHVGCF